VGLVAPLVALLLALLYGKILRALGIQWWEDPNYSHGFIVPIFSGYLIWRQRLALARIIPAGTMAGVVVLLAGLACLLVGDLGAENFLMRGSLIVVLIGLVLFHLGAETFRLTWFPLAYLIFMVPLPGVVFYAITFPLQQLAAQQAAGALELLGVPVLLDGNVIQLSQITLGVTEACSGIRSLISLLAGAVAWAYLVLPWGWGAIVFVAATIPITIVANAGRVVATGLIGQWFGVEYASGFFHEFAGWVIYVFAFLCLIGVQALIQLAGRLRAGGRA
jgi:exosortase